MRPMSSASLPFLGFVRTVQAGVWVRASDDALATVDANGFLVIFTVPEQNGAFVNGLPVRGSLVNISA